MPQHTRRGFLTAAAAAAAQTAPPSQPNVLLIMTDQQRPDSIGAYGNSIVRTPHIDSLARDGVTMENCWTQHPVCMPSRASIFTGRYPSVHGVRTNGVPLPRHETTLAQVFRANGYRTGGAGKFHFIPHFERQLPVMERHPEPYYGFDEFHLGEDGRRGEHALWIEREHPRWAGKPDHEIPIELHNSHWTASHTIRFIEESARRGQPFFAFCSFVDPHHGYNPPPPYRDMYKASDMPPPVLRAGELADKPPYFARLSESQRAWNERVPHHRAQYYGEVSFIDDSIGRVLGKLDELKLRDNTIIVFLSDHGDLLGDHHLFFKGPCHYRSCASVPLIFHWRNRLKAGKRVRGIVQEIDVFPTITELAGLKPTPGVQGRSQREVLTAATGHTGYEHALIEYGLAGANTADYRPAPGPETPDHYTLRSLAWRMTYYPGQPYGELYDLDKDPDEFVNRWDDPKLGAVRRKLKDQLLDRVLQSRDPLPARENRY